MPANSNYAQLHKVYGIFTADVQNPLCYPFYILRSYMQ